MLVQSKRNKHAALKLMRKLLKKYAFVPERLITDGLRSYSAAVHVLGIEQLPPAPAMEEQSGREFTSADAAAGAQDAAVQERGFPPRNSFNARPRLQHLQLPTSYHFSPNAPRASRCGDGHMADRRRSSLKIPAADASRSPPWQCDNPASRHDTAVRCSPPGNLAWKAGGPAQPYPHAAFGLGFRPRTMATRMTLRTRRLEFS